MRHFAIIGAGPRGLSALENLFIELSENKREEEVVVSIFETSDTPGSGNVWNTAQLKTNWLNISERALEGLNGRIPITLGDHCIPEFPSYSNWLPEEEQKRDEQEPDKFPERSKLGTYLNERFMSIAVELQMAGYLKIIRSEVIAIDYENKVFSLKTEDDCYEFDELLLSIGHQPTKISPQLKKWKKHEESNPKLQVFKEPYPVEDFMASEKINGSSVVAIRGFGLAMIDVVRALTIGKGGEFEILDKKTFQSKFTSNAQVPKKIIAFSLDGNPMVPKPLNAQIDSNYEPTAEEIENFEKIISENAHGQNEVTDTSFLKNAIAGIASRIYLDLQDKALSHELDQEELKQVIVEWLTDTDHKHDLILPTAQPAPKSIKAFIGMALGEAKVSLDYCIGQVWRHCQPSLYKEFSHANLEDKVIAATIALDERMKRYSYGPPIESMQQLLSLIDAGKLDLDLVENPEITQVKQGWKLENNRSKITAQIMINSVLDAPKIMEVTSPIIQNLLSNDLIEPIHSDLGINTKKDGCIEISNKEKFIPLAVLGRLSKGSVIGVDAILECFGPRVKDWAKGAVTRM